MAAVRRETGDGRRRLVVGLGASGASALRYLRAQGVDLVATDSRPAPVGIEALRTRFPEIEFRLGGFDAPPPLSQFAQAVVSPGVSLDEPLLHELRHAGVEIVGDVELFARALAAPSHVSRLTSHLAPTVVAITGSNGKSTVTTLVGEMARRAGRNVGVGGNLGEPALDLLAVDCDLYVLELSSFQLETTSSLAPAAAVWLNLSEDHLDRHKTLANYVAAKARVFHGARSAIVNRDDAVVMQNAPAAAVRFGLGAPRDGEYGLVEHAGGRWLAFGNERLLPLSALKLVGLHNAANALAALAAADAVGIPRAAALAALRDFPGLPHRCEWVAEGGGVTWINDSKGTNVGATLAALDGLPAPIVWLGGGQGKGQDFAPLRRPLAAKGRAGLLFGEDARRIEAVLADALPLEQVASLAVAVARARQLAHPGDRVLLSPACASLDQFRNYVERGDRFRELARHAAGEGA